MAKYFYDKYNALARRTYIEPSWSPNSGVMTEKMEGLYKAYSFNPNASNAKGVWSVYGGRWYSEMVRTGDIGYEITASGDLRKREVTSGSGMSYNYIDTRVSYKTCEEKDSITTYIKGSTLIQSNIQAENGTYPTNGVHTDGYWYVKKGLANQAPTISGKDEDLGEVIEPFTSKIKVTDEEGDKVDLVYTVNQVVLDKDNEYKRISLHTETKEDIELNTEIDYSVPIDIFKTMNIGNYELSIKAIDAEGGENEEVIKFTRTEDTIDFETKPIPTEVMPKQFISLIQLTGSPSNIKIMACNNGLDTKPIWEDVTENALKNTPYNFTNTSKTGAKWAIKIKVYLDGKEVK